MDKYRSACGPQMGCRQCGKELKGRRTAYCSNICSKEFQENHFWRFARAAVLRKARCRNPVDKRRWGYVCSVCNVYTDKPEVNHRMPLNGKRESFQCGHHQTNLHLVCKPCHLKITARQRELGLIGRAKKQKKM